MITKTTLRSLLKNFNFLLLLFCAPLSLQAEEASANASAPIFIPEPDFLWPAVSFPIDGSKRTLQTVAKRKKEELELFSVEEFAEMEKKDPLWKIYALKCADEILSTLPVRWIRDERDVILAAVLDGDSMDSCAALFAPSLQKKYEPVFGPEFYAVVPSRFRIYLFPKLATRIGEFAPLVLTDYRATAHPVSQEVFEISEKKIQSVGMMDDR